MSHITDLRSRESNPWYTRQVYYSLHHRGSPVTKDMLLSQQTVMTLIKCCISSGSSLVVKILIYRFQVCKGLSLALTIFQ